MADSSHDLDALQRRFADRYTIGRQLGRGGMGAVYLARDIQLDRPVAIKVLPSEFASQSDLRERFLRETRTAAGFSHPNIVPVFAVEDRGDVLAMAMGYLEGESVAERVKRLGPLTVKETVRLLQDVGYALAYAHGRSVVHRDIKPDNIMLERATGRALVMDFGISRSISAEVSQKAGLTRVGEVVGTPEFMSPEQASGDRVDGRSDLYSLGLVAWFAVTGQYAISGESTQKILVKQLTETIPPISGVRGDLPTPLADAIDKLLKKDPADRFATAEALVEAIDAAQLGAPEVPLPIRLFEQSGKSYVWNALLVLVGAAYIYSQTDPGADVDRKATLSLSVLFEFVLLANIARQARTLGKLGFDHGALRRGLRAIRDEGDEARAQALAVPGVARKRRARFALSPMMVVLGIYNIRNGLAARIENTDGTHSISTVGSMNLISGAGAVVVAVLLVMLDPFRTPIMQRVAHLFWGSAAGRLLMGRGAPDTGASGITKRTVKAVAAPVAVPAAPMGAASNPEARLDRIEARLSALEKERRG